MAKAAHEAAAAVVALMHSVDDLNCCHKHELTRGANAGSVVYDGGADRRRSFDVGLEEVKAQLARNNIPNQAFQAQLLFALRAEGTMENAERSATIGSDRIGTGSYVSAVGDAGHCFVNLACACGEPRRECPRRPLVMLWRLHELGLLPLSRLLEANETLPLPFLWGQRDSGGLGISGFGDTFDYCAEAIVQGVRALVVQSVGEAGDPDQQEDTATLISDVAKHLFDVGYRKLPGVVESMVAGDSATGASSAARGHPGEALSRRAARRVLDRLCCGPEMFG